MVKPLPWGPSKLKTFDTCPKMFHGQYVLKKFPRQESPENAHGDYVHSAFENFMGTDVPLPPDLIGFQDYLKAIDEKPGFFFVELKAAFDTRGKPCSWDWRKDDIWALLKIDYLKIDYNREVPIAWIYDYKTGKKKPDPLQLIQYALYVFAAFAKVEIIDARFFWTQDKTETRMGWSRKEIPDLWEKLIPLLQQYKEAFKTDTWQARKNGLCNGFCPDTECQFWQPKRS